MLDELGINMGAAVPEAPVGLATTSAPVATEAAQPGASIVVPLYSYDGNCICV